MYAAESKIRDHPAAQVEQGEMRAECLAINGRKGRVTEVSVGIPWVVGSLMIMLDVPSFACRTGFRSSEWCSLHSPLFHACVLA